MQIGRVASIASSGLRLESQRLSQSAHNVANVNTDGFQAGQVVAQEQAEGGVVGRYASTYGPTALQTRDDGLSLPQSNTDLAEERVSQLGSLRSFQANVAVLQTADQMLGELVRRKA